MFPSLLITEEEWDEGGVSLVLWAAMPRWFSFLHTPRDECSHWAWTS